MDPPAVQQKISLRAGPWSMIFAEESYATPVKLRQYDCASSHISPAAFILRPPSVQLVELTLFRSIRWLS